MNASDSAPLESILNKIRTNQFSLEDAKNLVSYPDKLDYTTFFGSVAELLLSKSNKHPKMKIYVPGTSFQAISVTGTSCELSCDHCDKKYLKSMVQAPTTSSFKESLNKLAENHAVGALLSGGSTLDGKVPLLKYSKEIKEFKETHDFYLNSHVGLVSFEEAMLLKEIGIDVVSYDLVLDPEVIENVFHMAHTPQDYIDTYLNLKKAGLRVVPHILIGARYGYFAEEFKALGLLMEHPPELLVFIIMIPPKTDRSPHTVNKHKPFSLISASLAARFILGCRLLMPRTGFSLGCMRPRGKISLNLEKWAIQSGISRIEIPTRKTIKWMEKVGYELNISGHAVPCRQNWKKKPEFHPLQENLLNFHNSGT